MSLDATLAAAELKRLRDLCADGMRIDLLRAGLTLSVLQRDETINRAPLHQHVDAIASVTPPNGARCGACAWPAIRSSTPPRRATMSISPSLVL